MNTKHLARPFEMKSLKSDGTFTGYGSVFGVEDSYGDVVQPGAFKASLEAWKAKGQLPALLWQHRSDSPIGVWRSMAEDSHGLLVEGELALKTQQGTEAYELLKLGAIRGLSIGYAIPKGGGEWDPKTEQFLLKQVDLWETSLVTFPANEDAQVETVKSILDSPKNLERFLREAGLPRSVAKALVAGGYDRTADLREADGATGNPEAKTAVRNLIAALGR